MNIDFRLVPLEYAKEQIKRKSNSASLGAEREQIAELVEKRTDERGISYMAFTDPDSIEKVKRGDYLLNPYNPYKKSYRKLKVVDINLKKGWVRVNSKHVTYLSKDQIKFANI